MIDRKWFVLGGLVMSLAVTCPVKAAAIAYQDPADVGNQLWIGSLGEDFTVNTPIVVDMIGVYDSGQDGILGVLTAAIFASNGTQETPTQTFTGTSGSLIGGDLFLTLGTPVTLAPGDYSITVAGWGPNAPNPDGNANCVGNPGCNGGGAYTPPTLDTGGGLLTFTGIGYLAGGGLQYLAPAPGYPADEFNSGSFQYSSALTIPEPGPAIAVALGLLAFLMRRRALSGFNRLGESTLR